MMGLLVLVVLGFYLAISILVVIGVSTLSRRLLGAGWPAGFLAALVMYCLVFWDAIPTWYTHHHLCATEAGLKVYQTPEEWAKENPERYQKAMIVIASRSTDDPDATHRFTDYASGLSLEFYSSHRRNYEFNTGIVRERVFDSVTGKVLFEKVDFYGGAGKRSLAVGAQTFADYKFWTVTGSCSRAYPSMRDRFKYQGRTLSGFLNAMAGWTVK